MSFTLFIDSAKRTANSTSSTDFHIQFTGNFPEIHFAELLWAAIPLSTFTISSTNNTIYFNENATNKSATIPAGYYSGSSLADAAQSALNSVSGGYNTYTVSYSSSTYKMTFSAANPFSLLWATQPSPNLAFGFPATNTVSATSVTSTQACQLNSPQACNISIRELDNPIYTGSTMLGSTFIIPLASGSSYLNVYEPHSRVVVTTQPRVFNRFYIKLTDMDSNPLSLGNSDWQFAVTLYTAEEFKKRAAKHDSDERSVKRMLL
jgi:hypothetical protein